MDVKPLQVKPLRFLHRGQWRHIENVPPTRTLLALLREDLHLCGTKEGCNEGDCGACTVVLRDPLDTQYKAVNSCIRLAHSIEGLELTTVEDLADGEQLHPAQEALLECHGSQCGFCTPGFVMSMYALYENARRTGQEIDRATAQQALSGNLCRCTGYRPILDAAVQMQHLKDQRSSMKKAAESGEQQARARPGTSGAYLLPKNLDELLTLRKTHRRAQIVAGCTDVGIWINKGHQQFTQILDVTRVEQLLRIERYPHHIAIGAAVSLADAYAALVQDRPQLKTFAQRFAGLPVRNSGTLGGNIVNGSPIGDSMPLLIALGANVVLMSLRGQREFPIEYLYTGYRKNIIAADEILAWIKVPLPTAQEFCRVYKISKRYDDDISAVCLALCAQRQGKDLQSIRIGVGGVAATPVRATKTEAACADAVASVAPFKVLAKQLKKEFKPISDMRASGAYRRRLLGALMQRFAAEWYGNRWVSLESWDDLKRVL